MASKSVDQPKHIQVIRDDLLTICSQARKHEPITHRKYALYRLRIPGTQVQEIGVKEM